MKTSAAIVTFCLLLLLAGGTAALLYHSQESGDNSAGRGMAHVTDVAPVPADTVSKGEGADTEEPRAAADNMSQPAPVEATVSQTKSPPARVEPESEPAGLFSISGMVLDESGRGVYGIEVAAYPKSLFAPEQDAAEARTGGGVTALTDIDGFYEVRGVADGEYRLRTEPDDRYEAAELIVRAGVDTADLVLRARRPALEIGGTVRGDGEALSGVEVVAVGQPSGAVYTEEDGSYEIEVQISAAKPSYTLRFARDGYREERSVLMAEDLAAPGQIRVDADLEPRQALVEVTGSVRDREGEPVSGETVQLNSEAARQRYTAVSGRQGEIRFPEVETSDDYMVSVRPAELHRDFVVRNVEIGVAGAELDVVLEPRSYGRLAGQMVDPDGQPVPEFNLWLRNPGAVNQPARLVTGDQQGYFEVDRVEAGSLVFETRGSPLVSITGLRLSPGESKQVTLVLDWGTHQVAGLVMDDMGRPVSASELFVTSVRRDGSLRAQAVRRAVTDETGYFLVERVGSGYHTVRVDAPGFRAAVVDHQVGTDSPEVIIRLERVYSHGM
jgi:protocatechuate 3,4-dioxygenase beta subunit